MIKILNKLKNKEILPFATTQMNLKNVLIGISQTQDNYSMIPFISGA
jgi:hypothetical protein